MGMRIILWFIILTARGIQQEQQLLFAVALFLNIPYSRRQKMLFNADNDRLRGIYNVI